MTKQHNHTSITQNISQESNQPLGNLKAVKPPRKDEFLLVPEESPPFTISEHIICLLETLEGQLPQALRALSTIAEAVDAQPDHSDQFQELIAVLTEIEHRLKAKEKSHQSSEEV